MKKILLLLALTMSASILHAQDVEVRLHERVLNTVISVLAPINGEGDFNSPLGGGHYTWVLKNPRLTVQNDGLSFIANTRVSLNGVTYDTTSKGRATTRINDKTKKIELQIEKASFALQLSIFGNKIHLTDVDISSMVNQKFALDTPTFNQVVQVPAEGARPTKNISMTTGTPAIGFAPPFLVISSPLVATEK
jgi:hypothetical protein